MLRHLIIENLVLVERAELQFDAGLTILSGETGAGKSAILKALSLILGAKGDGSLLRTGMERGHVEALFDLSPHNRALLESAGIPTDEELLIRREISAGRSRTYINHALAQRPLLLQLDLLDLVGQHANQRLMSLSYHREIVDLFGNIDLQPYKEAYRTLQQLQQQKLDLEAAQSERLRQIATCRRELEELDPAPLDTDEEQLQSDHNRLTHAETLLSTTSRLLGRSEQAILPALRSCISELESAPDSRLQEILASFRSGYAEIDEAVHELRSYESSLSPDPATLQQLNDQIALLESLKRKYGKTLLDVAHYREGTRERLAQLEMAEPSKLDAEIATQQGLCDQLASQLTEARTRSAAKLTQVWLQQLRPLNLAKAQIEIRLTPTIRTEWGDEQPEVYFAPNVGEGMLPIRQASSGGELSRLLLALKTALAGLERTPTLIFDEIDANMGGQTATLVGQNLHSISKERQVLCITHLPQVARLGDTHFQISKRESGGRTLSTVTQLTDSQRREELTRMLGADSLDQLLLS